MFVSDFTKPPEEVVIDLINFDNGTAFTPATLSMVGAPTAIPKAPPAFRNTEIRVKPSSLTRKVGTARLYYNRINLADVPGILRSVIFDLHPNATRIRDVIPYINERYRINLTADDYVDAELPELIAASQTVTIQATPESLVYIGALDIGVKLDPGQGVPLGNVITQQYLEIFRFVPHPA